MKRTFAALLILGALAGVSALHIHKLKTLTQEMTETITHSLTTYTGGSTAEAETLLMDAVMLWQAHEGYLKIFLHHETVDSTNDTLYSVLSALRRDDDSVPLEYKLLLEKVSQVLEDERLLPVSIL